MVWWQSEEIHILNNQKDQNLNKDYAKIIYTPANHHSRRTLFDYQKSLWGSWVVIGSDGSKFWFGGDTAYSDVFKQIGKRYGPFDLSAIPIGICFMSNFKFVRDLSLAMLTSFWLF